MNERATASVSLVNLLAQLQSFYQVTFNYDSDILEGLVANEDAITLKTKEVKELEANLEVVLHPEGLKYERSREDIYLIYSDKKRSETPVSNKSTSATGTQQEQQVSGKITDAAGVGLPGVSIAVKGTSRGTITNADGTYSLSVPDGNSTLVVSFLGFETQEIALNGRAVVDVSMAEDTEALQEVVVVGYSTQTKESITSAVSTVSSEDIEKVAAATVSATLAGKLPGVAFRMAEGRPGSGAEIQIRNMGGNPLFVIDGIQQDQGQFNNLSPQDIASITVLKDAAASVYGSRAANGVVIVTTKRGKRGEKPTINLNAYYGGQSWTRFPETVNAYEWMRGRAEAEMNALNPGTQITPEELEKWRQGTERGYQNFDWYDFIIQENAPQSQISVNTQGGSERINYYISLTRLDQSSVLGREFIFERTNIQSNLDANITDRLKVGVQINGRIESRDQPGIPGVDDYWLPRFALFRNRPYERPYANDNPDYIAHISQVDANWAYANKKTAGYWTEDWRVLQSNFSLDYELPIEGLKVRGMYSYYMADRLMNGHEYTYDVYTYFPATEDAPEEYRRTGGADNPWRERETRKIFNNVLQGQISYNNTFSDKHTVGATLVYERIQNRNVGAWLHSVPTNNELPLIQFADMDTYNDWDDEQARIGYVGQFNYSFADKYYVDMSARYDASWKFSPDDRWGFFPSASIGWRITNEEFFRSLVGGNFLSDLKLRASYGKLGDDDVGIGPFDYLTGYNYGSSNMIIGGNLLRGARIQRNGVPITNISWFTSTILDIGLDYSFLNGKFSGALDYFRREREGLLGRRWDILTPVEIGYDLPSENTQSDAVIGGEGSVAYNHQIGELTFSVGANLSYARQKRLESYKPRWGNSWDHYRTAGQNEKYDDRWQDITWGYEVIGQFKSQDEISEYPVNIDGQGNRTLLPGDLIYEDVNGDGVINGMDERPIGYKLGGTPIVNYGLNLSAAWKGFDLTADFSGGSMYAYNRAWEMRNPYQNTGNLLQDMYDDRWHREDPFNLDSPWIPGKYPALRWNEGGHSNYNKTSSFWLQNMTYLRLRTLEVGYSLPVSLLSKVKVQKARLFVNSYNLFSIDPLRTVGLDPEIRDENGLQYPQHRIINVGTNLSF
ncbi:SusC/RagA family TonB-linked outer membrane protein [Pontibacter russatus]|uniref:SusC/RagA family TonB-linked outer membrane protein n=1 Tax=Pontibacter russatus TaxID=2694929 RepID=UPI001F350A42|nr:TonB-dependent receptor [Pontibacter russatus]